MNRMTQLEVLNNLVLSAIALRDKEDKANINGIVALAQGEEYISKVYSLLKGSYQVAALIHEVAARDKLNEILLSK